MLDLASQANNTWAREHPYTPFVDPKICNMGAIAFYTACYGYVLFEASNLISDGGELLLLVPKIAPIVGSVVLPVLGAVPDGMMVLFSGVGADAQEEITVGVGTLAGSTIMLLTLPWFLALLGGRVNIVNGQPTYKRPKNAPEEWDKLTPPGNMSLTGTGVGINSAVHRGAKLMLGTLVVYIIVQVPAAWLCLFKKPKDMDYHTLKSMRDFEAEAIRPFLLIGLFFCFITFAMYLFLEWTHANGQGSDELEGRIADYHTQALKDGKVTLRGAMANFSDESWVAEVVAGNVNKVMTDKESLRKVRKVCKVLAPFFQSYDVNSSDDIDYDGFQTFFQDVSEFRPASKDVLGQLFRQADVDNSGTITFEEFVACCMVFTWDKSPLVGILGPAPIKCKRTSLEPSAYLDVKMRAAMKAATEGEEDEDEDDAEEEDLPEDLADLDPVEQQRRLKNRALLKMALGGLLTLTFSDPMVDLLSEMAKRWNMSSFYTSFVLAPLTSNASELVASYNISKKKTQSSIGSSFSCLEGAAVMNNTFGLGIFFAVMIFQNLAWEFTAETISMVVIQILMGIVVLRSTHQRILDGLLIVSFYPLAMILVGVLENVFNIN